MKAGTAFSTDDRGDEARLLATFEQQRRASRAEPPPGLAERREMLGEIETIIDRHGDEVVRTIAADYNGRARQETEVAELYTVRAAVRHMRRRLADWMRPERVAVALPFKPSRAEIRRVPLGVVGIVAPWNYPFQLAMLPLATALAAGNRVMLKPSELMPRTGDMLRERLGERFPPERVSVHPGGLAFAERFVGLPFDHLFFTGSPEVGRKVALAAAVNLTPVTLELGGKSPAIVAADADLRSAAEAIVYGRLLNAGQTCVAADYLMVDRRVHGAFAAALGAAVRRMYPDPARNDQYSSILTSRHAARLDALVADARSLGAVVTQLGETLPDEPCRYVPVIVDQARPGMRVLQEEIFGPLFSIVPVDGIADAIKLINELTRPLALYFFGRDTRPLDRLLERCVVGGVTVNGVFLHMAQENLPFGGVGESGYGAYHGEDGFLQLSKRVPVFHQSRLSSVTRMFPPYGVTFDRLSRIMRLIS